MEVVYNKKINNLEFILKCLQNNNNNNNNNNKY